MLFQCPSIRTQTGSIGQFDGPAIHPLLLGVLDDVLGHYQLSAPTGIQIGPGEKAQVLHRDDSIYPLPREFRDVVMNTMWALQDFTGENGATRLVPGSHTWTDRMPKPSDPVVTALEPASTFFEAEAYHQRYFENNPNQPYCSYVVAPKVQKFRKKFTTRMKAR